MWPTYYIVDKKKKAVYRIPKNLKNNNSTTSGML